MKKQLLKKSQNNIGSISIYLCMMFAVMVSIILVLIEGSRISAMKQTIECTLDMGTDSLLAEYHQELLNRYGLLFIDTAYDMTSGSLDNTVNHITSYMEYNLGPVKDIVLTGKTRDVLGLSVDSVEITKASRATDNQGAVFRHLAISYMLDTYGLSYIDSAKDLVATYDSYNLGDGDIISENQKAQKDIDNIELPEIEDVDWNEVDTSNPSENVRKAKGKGILSLVCSSKVSSKSYDISTLASKRNLVNGDGLYDKWPNYDGFGYQILFNEYIMKMLGNKLEIKDDSVLNYQVEYVLFGQANDTDNLRKTADRLVLIRGASNTLYYGTHSELKAEVKAAALALSVVTLVPYLEKVYEVALAAALIYAESLYDVSVLLDGGKVPLIKSKGDWTFSLEGALEKLAGSFTNSGKGHDKGQSYQDYLRILLYVTNINDKTKRTMDIVEMDIRSITNNNNFRLDNCIAAGEVEAIIKSIYGYTFLIKRSFCYW